MDNLIIYIVFFLALVIYFRLIVPVIKERLCLKKVKRLIFEHATTLSVQRSRLLTTDVYGNASDDAWRKEIDKFIENTIIKRQLTEAEKDIMEFEKPYQKAVQFVELVAKERAQFFNDNIAYTDSLTGQQYELLCKETLAKTGWNVELTKVVGDQGVDLIASKGNYRVAIQCKKYASSIGNSAVQEVIAGKAFYQTTHGVVVSNAPYTRAAIELAKVNGIRLLHHNDLIQEDFPF